ncbi:hypothetical protein [Chamaesiphon sp. VAR_48_metabat_135_sub]|uniref:hypothetical protein n=1 Tax=Chamaesiphon sp. VAR_48_metabat_135_sub TaxID=2964699 RepID=UPI00286CFA8E|nr:hypothetical protein [Chamaesiphon sp. VAR_48_metabat_135_sub]
MFGGSIAILVPAIAQTSLTPSKTYLANGLAKYKPDDLGGAFTDLDRAIRIDPQLAKTDRGKSAMSDKKGTTAAPNFTKQPPMGELGQTLGKVITISGIVSQAALGSKADKFDLVLSIKTVNDRALAKPIIMGFKIFERAKVVPPILGQTFRYVGYETGGFVGIPAEAFKWVEPVATTNHHFESFYQILHEDLPQIKVKADLLKSKDRRVQIIGKYVSTPRQKSTKTNANAVHPISGEPLSSESYATVNIELADGTLVPLYSPLNKRSNITWGEVKAFDGKLVSIVGLLAIEPISPSIKAESKMTIVRMDRIELHQDR